MKRNITGVLVGRSNADGRTGGWRNGTETPKEMFHPSISPAFRPYFVYTPGAERPLNSTQRNRHVTATVLDSPAYALYLAPIPILQGYSACIDFCSAMAPV